MPEPRAVTESVEEQIARAVRDLDVAAIRDRYWSHNQFVCLERWLPPSLVSALVGDVDRVRPAIHRNYIPRHKKGGSVSYHVLKAEAAAILALYRSPAFLGLVRAITGQPVRLCPDTDPHACALYFYTEPGDHIGFHFDTSYYKGSRFTVLVGLVERSSSRLLAQPFKSVRGREALELRLATEPGTVVLFNGDTLWHAITPLGDGEERVSLTLEYVTDPGMTRVKRFISNMKDSIAYFGFRSVFLGSGR